MRSTWIRNRRCISMVAALLVVVAASVVQTPVASAQEDGWVRTASGEIIADVALLEAARAEGQVTYYATTDLEPTTIILQEFEKRFGIKTNLFKAPGTRLFERFVAESRSRSHQADVIEISDVVAVERLREAGYLAEYVPLTAAAIPARAKNEPYWYGIHGTYIATAWNTDLIGDADVPATWEDLTDPKLRGELALIAPVGGTVYIPNYMWRYSLADRFGTKFWEGLRANQPLFYESQYPAADRLAAGEFMVLGHVIEDAVYSVYQNGAPVRWKFLNPTPQQFDAAGVNANAPHPNAARLLLSWFLSDEGQYLWMKHAGHVSLRPDVEDPRPVVNEPWYSKPTEVYVVEDIDHYAEVLESLIDEWHDAFGYGR